MRCAYCSENAIFFCAACGNPVCSKHISIRPICHVHHNDRALSYRIRLAKYAYERELVGRLVKQFWGESEQVTFGRKFVVADLPTYLADVQRSVAGFISFSETEKSLLIVALAVVPQFQNCGVGAALIKKVEIEANVMGKEMLLVSSSNDDLAALGFYQKMGFQIFSVKPDIIAEKHGGVMEGIGGLPIRDELRLRKRIV